MICFGSRPPTRLAHLARHLAASALVPPPPPFRKVLVANRGEIALRVFRAAHELGCASAAVFTPADTGALHCTEAGEAHALDGNGYLDGAAVLRCAAAAGADAVHPGYGFLSEDAAFAEAVLAAGLAWVGPPPAALRLFGDKVAARAHARAHGVPVAAGSAAPVADASSALAAAAAAGCGWPLLLKAAHGGGGRGIRLVADAAAMEGAFASASREAAAAFGSGELFVEECLVGY
jgi:acetyl-CoA/propionyl-CoA carboxylase biotin carboxyl carrier protein